MHNFCKVHCQANTCQWDVILYCPCWGFATENRLKHKSRNRLLYQRLALDNLPSSLTSLKHRHVWRIKDGPDWLCRCRRSRVDREIRAIVERFCLGVVGSSMICDLRFAPQSSSEAASDAEHFQRCILRNMIYIQPEKSCSG